MTSTNPQQLLTLLQSARGQPAESLVRDHVQTLMAHRADLQKAHQMLQQAKAPSVTPAARTLVGEHANTLLKNSSESHMLTQMQKLAKLLKLAKMSPIQQHAVSDAYKAHMAAPTAPAARPMVRDPHAFSQHASMMQNPGDYRPQGQVSSGLELATPPRAYKRASELEKLSTMLKDNKSWLPEGKKKKDTAGMAGNEGCSKTSEVQKLAELLQKRAAAAPVGFMQRGLNQIGGAIKNPASLSTGVQKAWKQGDGVLGGISNVAQKYAPAAAMIGAPLAAGAALGYAAAPSQPDQTRMASLKAAFSITDEGHKLDAAHYNIESEAAHKKVKPQQEYAEARPGMAQVASTAHILSLLGPILNIPGSHLIPVSNASSHGALFNQMEARHKDYAAKKHEQGENAYNPFGGVMTKSRHEEKDEKKDAKKDSKPDTKKTSSFGPEMHKLSGMMGTLGKGLGMAGKAVGIVPGVGTAIGAGLGGIGGAMAAPPGKRLAGAALGAATGAMGPIAGTAVNMAGSRMLGV